jgi:hypothetical protein
VDRIDWKKQYRELYHASAKDVVQVDVPAFRFLMVDGTGYPGTSREYTEAVEALFAVSYTAKFMVKKGPHPVDYAVMPLEGLWWADDMATFARGDKKGWKWTVMILQPDVAIDEIIAAAIAEVQRKKALPGVQRLRLETFTEGKCAQVLHVGPFSHEGPTIERLHAFIEATSTLRGKHHEIYLSDIRRADPSRWKTIVRQPMT